ncbi:hypothetical protein [Phaeovulum sp.]|jgi:hypothetical protein|uniref:hypothetical protein n=1 Tax=Phaeovulum sp. TaxID=2934796 RepID=UPI00272F593D|nr:hypothetical protein [Phaeovulum sp.]MDP1668781.1 hypothetical protein [Phaeovulum sp.]MDP2063142.1 hypothetical protein [Phaeovulum sp.]MDP3860841.1 hypothetical protein [Phaeovulum sp.]MDZ4120597.1 hypothetical protein [Phaeovulum sp.]
MTRLIAFAVLALAGCTDPALTARIKMDDTGVRVQPVITGQIGGLTVGVAP